MKNTLLVLVVVIVLGIGGYFLMNKKSAVNEEKLEPTSEAVMEKETAKQAKEFMVEGAPFTFSLKEMRVKQGDTVTVTFANKEGFHDWVLDEFNARTKQIKTGETDAVTFVADQAGTFEYYCSVGNHRAQGMVGKLIVE